MTIFFPLGILITRTVHHHIPDTFKEVETWSIEEHYTQDTCKQTETVFVDVEYQYHIQDTCKKTESVIMVHCHYTQQDTKTVTTDMDNHHHHHMKAEEVWTLDQRALEGYNNVMVALDNASLNYADTTGTEDIILIILTNNTVINIA